jgi:hypothetical protein
MIGPTLVGAFFVNHPEQPSRQLRSRSAHSKEVGSMAMQQTSSDLNKRETGSLIGSDKVEGTDVYNPNGDRVGTIERVMIDKISGKVAYAVLSFGGFLGMGEDYYPVPWATLKYDTKLGGYVLGLTRDELEQAPKYSESQGWNWSRENDQRVYDYYRTDPYWS